MSKLRGKNTQNIKIRQFGTEFQKHEACHKFFDVWLDIYRALWRWNFVQTFAVLLIHFRVTALRFDWLYRHFRSHANLIHLCVSVSVSDSIRQWRNVLSFRSKSISVSLEQEHRLLKIGALKCVRECAILFLTKRILLVLNHTHKHSHIFTQSASLCSSFFLTSKP